MSEVLQRANEAFARNDLAIAEAFGVKALDKSPNGIEPRLLLGAIYARTRRFVPAVKMLESVLGRDPNNCQALDWMADALRKLGRLEEALSAADRSSALAPHNPDAHFTAGVCLLALGRPVEAEPRLRAVLAKARPPMALHSLALSLIRQNRPEKAVPLLEEALRAEPEVPHHMVALAQARLGMQQFRESEEMARAALEIRPKDPVAHLALAQALVMGGDASHAERHIRAAMENNPDSAEALGLYGTWLHQMGRFEEAEEHFDQALRADPEQSLPLYFKVQGRKMTAEDSPLIDSLTRRLESAKCVDEERIALHFALGKAYDDLRDPERAFEHYDSANAIRAAIQQRVDPYSGASHAAYVDKVMSLFTEANLRRWTEFGNPSDRPIFVVGMIRSGTTLMEQLLSAHPEVEGTGELQYWPDEALELLGPKTEDLDPEAVRRLGDEFLRELRERSPEGLHVTDKMPTNFQLLGFIHSSLPNAKIIHMVRDPLDVALSIWTTYIRQAPPFIADKANIKMALAQHDRLRDHWAAVLPADRYLQVRYEDLTREPERVMRSLLEFLGLDWNEECVHPERNDRTVSTPSMYRVRKPIDQASVRKADRYRPYLGAFGYLG